jgi:mannitol-1-phosphate/altronate dehydrogenase
MTTVLTILLLAAVGGAGWFAYTAYVEHDSNEQVETDRRVAELQQERSGRTTGDIINELEQTPAWNGPGNPTFGVGGNTADP